MIKLLIFDLDGTLVSAYPAVARSVNFTLKQLGLPTQSFNEIKRSVGGGDYKLMAHFAGIKLADKAINLYRPHHTKALQAKGGVRLLPGSLSLLTFLKSNGYKLAIASNRPTRYTRIILRKLDILKFFNTVLCADKAQKPKPYPEILWEIAKKLKVETKDILYVGDMTIDIRCGQDAGVKVVAVATGSSPKKELKALKPWRVIDRILEVKTIIKE